MQRSKEGSDAGKQLKSSLAAPPSVQEDPSLPSIESNIAILVSQLQPPPSPRSPRSRSPSPSSRSPSPSGRGNQKYTLEDMEKMRKEIRQLQERRAEAMMNEMAELQREKNTALGKVKILTQTVEVISAENAMLRAKLGKRGGEEEEPEHLFRLEKLIQEEKLYSSDLKKKLQAANRHIANTRTKMEAIEKGGALGKVQSAVSLLKVAEGDATNIERSQSMSNLEGKEEGGRSKTEGQQKGGSPPAQYHLPRLPKQQWASPKPAREERATDLKTTSYPASPTVIPRKYKLATVDHLSVATQVDNTTSPEDEGVVKEKEDAERAALQKEVEELEKEKQELEEVIAGLTAQTEDLREHTAKSKVKQLRTEAHLLRDSLSEFSKWVRKKINLVEEDIDLCRVIYTLHGSLSQETSLMKDLQGRLALYQQKVADLDIENIHLRDELKDIQEKCKNLKKQNELQQEKIVLLTPTKLSKQTFYTPSPLTSFHRPPVHSKTEPALVPSRAAIPPENKTSPAVVKALPQQPSPKRVTKPQNYGELTGSPSRERQYGVNEDGNVV